MLALWLFEEIRCTEVVSMTSILDGTWSFLCLWEALYVIYRPPKGASWSSPQLSFPRACFHIHVMMSAIKTASREVG